MTNQAIDQTPRQRFQTAIALITPRISGSHLNRCLGTLTLLLSGNQGVPPT